MINGLFREISEEEMMTVNGGCGGGGAGGSGSSHTIAGININVFGICEMPASEPKSEKEEPNYTIPDRILSDEANAAWDAYGWEQGGGYINGNGR